MNIHWLQHVKFEGLGMISTWAKENDHSLSCTRFWNGDLLPGKLNFDMLIIMGGPMSIHDEDQHPWLVEEKHFICRCIENDIPIVGICLGAQLLANALGGEVRPHQVKEIGWFPVERCLGAEQELANILPPSQLVLHWHGETFSLPSGAWHLWRSEACTNQGFICNKRFIGLQFHLEIGKTELPLLIDNCRSELVEGEWIQNEKELMLGVENDQECREVLFQILDFMSLQEQK